jgi:hypothetical protein
MPDQPLQPRSSWAIHTVAQTPLPTRPATHLILHHLAGGIEGSDIDLDNDGLPDSFERIMRDTEAFHLFVRGWRGGIAYNAVVGHKGSRAEGRGPLYQGGATGNPHDTFSLSIGLMGDYHTKHEVTPELIRAVVLTAADWIEQGHLVPLRKLTIIGHQDKPFATACPGDRFIPVIKTLKPLIKAELKRRRIQRRLDAARKELRELRQERRIRAAILQRRIARLRAQL